MEAGKGMEKALELAKKIASNTGVTNYALMHMLPRISRCSTGPGIDNGIA